MRKLNFITNIKEILEDVRINKNEILQKDTTNIMFVKINSKEDIFKEEFIIRDVALLEKVSKDAEKYEELADRIIFKKKDATVDFIKSEADDAIIPTETLGKIEELKYDDAVKIILTDDVKKKLTTAIDYGFSETLKIHSDAENIKVSIGGKEGKHKYSAILGNSKETFEHTFGTDFLKTILGCLKGYSEMFVKENYPIKFADKAEDYTMEIYLAPRSGE